MNRLYKELEREIVKAIREKAQGIPVFKDPGNGAIRILAYPLCPKADQWLGGKGLISEDENGGAILVDTPDYETTFAITPGGSRVIKSFWGNAWHLVDCYAFSAMKIAHCSRADDLGMGLESGLNLGDPNLNEECGYGPYPGAICVGIYEKIDNEDPTDFCLIYVCVSGAEGHEDNACAVAAIDVIKKFFKGEENDHRMYLFRTPPKNHSLPPHA